MTTKTHRPILVVGFGPFLEIEDNPAAAVARAVDGARLEDGRQVVGRVMPVSYLRAPKLTLEWQRELDARAVVGIGVARSRSWITVETRGYREVSQQFPDVDGQMPSQLSEDGPVHVELTAPAEALARWLEGVVGVDPGRYVCNGWVYQIGRALSDDVPSTFIHIPPAGLPPQRLLKAMTVLWSGKRGPDEFRTEQ